MFNKAIVLLLAALMVFSTSACRTQEASTKSTTEEKSLSVESGGIVTNLSKINMSQWEYNPNDNVYYQIGIHYCETPLDAYYETLAVFVPGDYFIGSDNGDGTYTCKINEKALLNGYTAETAPIVMPIDTPGYSAQAPLSSYVSLREYTDSGFIYVHAGCRGRDAGAPAGVVDLKAAIRYLRYTDDLIPGDAERIFVFGMSGGGAQSALVGATGDSSLYEPYLEAIGAVEGVSDAVYGSMDWCPITNLDSANEAYEWMMGVTRNGLSEEDQAISDKLASAFATYINAIGIKDENGNVLTLEESEEGIYQSGSYYDYILSVIEESLNNFLSDTEFPYDTSASTGKDGGPEGFRGFVLPEGEAVMEARGNFGGMMGKGGMGQVMDKGNFGEGLDLPYEDRDNIARNVTSNSIAISGVFETPEDYINALNADGTWITYDSLTNTVSISSIEAFVKAFKGVSKSLGAFDQLDGGQGENVLFGYGDGKGAHFDEVLADILKDLGSDYADDFYSDLGRTDSLGYSVEERLNMYTPLYYLLESEEGYGTSVPAKYWRIRTGIAQSDTSLTTEVNLALALENYEGVEAVDFATVWAQQHVKAERTGDSTTNFIEWVEQVMGY